jgi:hypothetical protein
LVGAGFSKNARVTSGLLPLDWRELGKTLAEDLPDSAFDNPLEAISAYGHAYGRVSLIAKTSELLRIQDALPAQTHRAFARLPFERILTTNFDLLLEKAYELVGRPCLPLVEESQLSGHNSYLGPTVLKLHGDVHHPHRMVITEDDYDNFLRDHPVLATHVAAQLIDHTAVLIGYSLDDPDMRQILALLRSRLGRLTRPLWAIQVNANNHIISRYERRGVHVVNLPMRDGQTYADVLEQLFAALAQYWQREVIEDSQSTDERTLADLRLPAESSNTCYFAVPLDLVPWYRDNLTAVVEEFGLVPVFARDVLTPEGTVVAKIEALISRARVVVIDAASLAAGFEAGMAFRLKEPGRILIVNEPDTPLLSDISGHWVLRRPGDLTSATDAFVAEVRGWLRDVLGPVQRTAESEVERLLAAEEPRAAIVAAVSLLEWHLTADLDLGHSGRRPTGMSQMVRTAAQIMRIEDSLTEKVMQAVRLRNEALHLQRPVTQQEAEDVVETVNSMLSKVAEFRLAAMDKPYNADSEEECLPASVLRLVRQSAPSDRVELYTIFLKRCVADLGARVTAPSSGDRPNVNIRPPAGSTGGRLATLNASSGRLAVFLNPELAAECPGAEVVMVKGEPAHLRIHLQDDVRVGQALRMVQKCMQSRS